MEMENESSQSQRAFLVAVDLPRHAEKLSQPTRPSTPELGWTAEESLGELALLADTAGAKMVGRAVQPRPALDPATFIGRGKAEEIEALRQQLGFDLVIFDDELSAVHQRNLETIIQCAVIDRTALILDIFAQRARSREAILQVELAQLQYRLTRLAGRGVDLSRLGGGIGTRGPGETRLETDRRRIRERVAHLREELQQVAARRQRLRQERHEHVHLPVVALTGYTNAGKSSLHRALTGSDVLVEDRLFATLDATARRVDQFILVDTVGFVQKLPHQLVAAFRSTLEEVVDADVILHVVDASHPKRQEQTDTVHQVLHELGVSERQELLVLNKMDRVNDPLEQQGVERFQHLYPDSVAVSARTRQGLELLLATVNRRLAAQRQVIEVLVPYDQTTWVNWLHEHGRILAEEHVEEGTRLRAELDRALAQHLLAQLPTAATRPRG